ncbi:hypothetical protein BGW38_006341 [Lunasporangiospora selenospora]|uniref:Uncharacterized protein n=1 Tax=Lunasporangiospora selenospora TaxID=979761 RepID=A0A9P6KGV7_9FUNG|nr:hypothetical protein BGW38_006341 [Lunasporangiospora selenospora]
MSSPAPSSRSIPSPTLAVPTSANRPRSGSAPQRPVSSLPPPPPEPPASEGRWNFRSTASFPAPRPFHNQGTKVYPSGSSTGTAVPLDLKSLAGKAPAPPPIGGNRHY